jgi:hypothetical protein
MIHFKAIQVLDGRQLLKPGEELKPFVKEWLKIADWP